MTKVLDYGLKVNKVELQLYHYIRFQSITLEKVMNPIIPLAMS